MLKNYGGDIISVLNDVLIDVIELAQAVPTAYAGIVIGSLPANDGISMTISAGNPVATDLQKSNAYALYIVLNGKNADQETVSAALEDMHEALTHRKDYPNKGKYQITNISTVAAPSLIDREPNGQWLYGSSLMIDFYYRNIQEN